VIFTLGLVVRKVVWRGNVRWLGDETCRANRRAWDSRGSCERAERPGLDPYAPASPSSRRANLERELPPRMRMAVDRQIVIMVINIFTTRFVSIAITGD